MSDTTEKKVDTSEKKLSKKTKKAIIAKATFSPGYKERLYQVLLSPLVNVTEKATKIAEMHNQISFKAIHNAGKNEIKDAVELIYKVKVTRVQTLWAKPKVKKRGMYEGVKQGYKKAIVSVKKGQEINFAAEMAKEKIGE